jgi:hypothetical protein
VVCNCYNMKEDDDFCVLFCHTFCIKTHDPIPVLKSVLNTSLSYALCQVHYQQIHWQHSLVYPIISCKICYEHFLMLFILHSVPYISFDSSTILCIFPNVCIFILRLLICIAYDVFGTFNGSVFSCCFTAERGLKEGYNFPHNVLDLFFFFRTRFQNYLI